MKKAIVLGASSGIGRELSRVLAREGYCMGLMARRLELLETLAEEINTQFFAPMDVSETQVASGQLKNLIERMGGVDLIVFCAGTGFLNPGLEWELESEIIGVNVRGFTFIADAAFRYFMRQGVGHFVAVSSIAAIRGSGACPAYNASKAYMSNYLEGLRCKAQKEAKNILITDIQPGLVDTQMAKGKKLFWMASSAEAAEQIAKIIRRGREKGYVTRRWGLIAFCLKIMPEWMYKRL